MTTSSSSRLWVLVLTAWLTGVATAEPFEAVPGGVVKVPLPSGFAPDWHVRWNDKPVFWRYVEDSPVALVGVPLDYNDETLVITVAGPGESGTEVVVAIGDKTYREQRLTIKNQNYVSPNDAQLERIGRERAVIDAALNHFSHRTPQTTRMAPPVDGRRSSSFGLRRFFNDQPRRPHSGMDIAAPTGTPIRLPLAGNVLATGDWYFNGNSVIVDHGRGLITLYCHLDRIDTEVSAELESGRGIGTVGATGRVTGPHLHWGVYLNGVAVDPAMFLADPS